MRKYFFASIAFIALLGQSYAQDMHARLDSLFSFYRSEYNFNGVALVVNKGDIVFEKAYGFKDMARKDTMDDGALFQVGTITTQFTAEMIMMLDEQHKLSLGDKLSKYFPKYPKGDSITIKNLLSQSTGIMDYFEMGEFLERYDSVHLKPDSLMTLFDKRVPRGVAGTYLQPSASNYFLLGQIIQKVTGKSFYDACKEMILKPAGMTHSGFDYRGLKSKEKCAGYRHYGEKDAMPYTDSCVSGAAASMYSSAIDLYKWHKALEKDQFLSAKLQDSMFHPVVRNYGYGWYADTVDEKIVCADGGRIRGFATYLYRIPSEDFCVILLQNISFPAIDQLMISRKVVNAFFDPSFEQPVPTPVVSISSAELTPYVGSYLFPNGVTVTVTKGDDMLHVHNEPPKGDIKKINDFDIYPIGDNKFKTKAFAAIIEFKITNQPGGAVATTLIMHDRHDIVAKRKNNPAPPHP